MKAGDKLIRLEGSPHVYIIRGMYRRHVANPGVFDALGAVIQDVRSVSKEEFNKYKEARPFTLKDIK